MLEGVFCYSTLSIVGVVFSHFDNIDIVSRNFDELNEYHEYIAIGFATNELCLIDILLFYGFMLSRLLSAYLEHSAYLKLLVIIISVVGATDAAHDHVLCAQRLSIVLPCVGTMEETHCKSERRTDMRIQQDIIELSRRRHDNDTYWSTIVSLFIVCFIETISQEKHD